MLRIAFGGIHTECSTYSPVLMAVEDFRLIAGEDMLSFDYFDFLPTDGVTLLPLLHAVPFRAGRFRGWLMSTSRRTSSPDCPPACRSTVSISPCMAR